VRLSEHGVAVGDALDRPVETIPNVWVQPGKAAVGGKRRAVRTSRLVQSAEVVDRRRWIAQRVG
jgi:hypothetical protein